MKPNSKEMIAALVKEGRKAKGYTQKELAELSNISIRSIQRIENGDLVPRSYTLKTLAAILDKPYDAFLQQPETAEVADIPEQEAVHQPANEKENITNTQRIILSAGAGASVFLLALAFSAQSSTFPETTFELLLFSVLILLLITAALFLIWRNRRS